MDNESLKDQLVFSLHRLRNVGRHFSADLDLNMGEFFVMERICRDMPCSGSDISAREVQEHPHFTKPAVSQMLNSLERKGYVHRAIDTNDRRRIIVTLTEDGVRTLASARKQMDRRIEQTIRRMGEGDIRTLIDLVSRIADITDDLKQGGTDA
jgi:DNA-binding MarR family transcriptional regulator